MKTPRVAVVGSVNVDAEIESQQLCPTENDISDICIKRSYVQTWMVVGTGCRGLLDDDLLQLSSSDNKDEEGGQEGRLFHVATLLEPVQPANSSLSPLERHSSLC